MRVATYYSNKDIRIEEKPRPKIGPGEILVRVESSGICGSDLMEWYRIDRVPLILGHEISGVVEETGEGIADFKKGDRVACAHHVPCAECHYCRQGHETVCETLRKTNFDPGGFVEFVRLPAINVREGTFPLPDNVSFGEATFVEPLACVLRGQRLAGGAKDKRVLVMGSGITGLLHIHFAKFCGASYILATDISDFRLQAAKKFGADESMQAKDYLPQSRFDLVIVSAASNKAIAQGLGSVDRGGTVLFFAPTDKGRQVPVNFNDLFWRREITLTSSYAGSPADYREALDLIASGKLNVGEMITHRFSLEQIGEGFKLVAEAGESIKVIIEPQR